MTLTFWNVASGMMVVALLLRYGPVLRKILDGASATVKAAGPLVPPQVAATVNAAALALDAFDDSQIAQEFAKRMATAASQAHLDTVLAEIRAAALARFTAIPSASPVVPAPHPAVAPPPKP